MPIRVDCWSMTEPKVPMTLGERTLDVDALKGDATVVEVVACGVCHTDLGFLYDGVRTRHPLPLTLGHEIVGRVVASGPEGLHAPGTAVIVPAVMPCGKCAACEAGRGAICPKQLFPGNDDHGGFASHVVVPGAGLCAIDEGRLTASGVDLSALAVVADAVTTPYQAIKNANLKAGDVAIFVGVGGVGAFGVQLAAALGAHVVAIDIDANRLEAIAPHGPTLCLDAAEGGRALRKTIAGWAKSNGHPRTGWKIFETSGNPAGQTLAFDLLTYDAHLAVVGYTREKITVRLSNLMAFDATARGTWGCLPSLYPEVVDLILDRKIALEPFITRRPMCEINSVFEALKAHTLKRRPVLIPDFGPASAPAPAERS